MPNPSDPDNSCPDIMTASVEQLVEMAKSKDKLLGCAARDELRRRDAPNEAASPELCAALGIDANDITEVLPSGAVMHRHTAEVRYPRTPKPHYTDRQGGGGALHRSWEQNPDEAMLKKAAESMAGESVKTKEAVITTVATYLANKADNWWMQPASFREKEMFIVVKFLVHSYSELERA
jgi:hypothetical protein